MIPFTNRASRRRPARWAWWTSRCSTGARRSDLNDNALLVHIKALHTEAHGGYGWLRTCKKLLASGIRVSKYRVRKLMDALGIRAKGKRRFKVTTDSNHDLLIAPNLLAREFTVAEPDKVRAGDFTPTSPPTKAGCSWRWSPTCSAAR